MRTIEFDFIAPPETAIKIDGQEFIIRPITLKLLPSVLAYIEPVLDDLLALVDAPTMEGGFKLVIKHGARVASAVALCAGCAAQAVEDMTPDRVAALLLVCCEVNIDFFSNAGRSVKAQAQAAAPRLLARYGDAIKSMSSAGMTPSAA